jgi:hypothetical protein
MILSASFSTENANPTETAIKKLRANLQNNIRPQPKAVAVLKITMGFKTGAAKRKVTPADSGSPLRKSRRVSGTVPHSQMGKISPSKAPLNAAGKARRGVMRVSQSSETKTSTSPEARVPINKNGRASMKIPRKTVAKVDSFSPNHGHADEGIMMYKIPAMTPSRTI